MQKNKSIECLLEALSYIFIAIGISSTVVMLIRSYPGGVFEPAGISLYEFGTAILALFINVMFATICYAINVIISDDVNIKILKTLTQVTKIVGLLTIVASLAVAYLIGDMFWGRSMIFLRIFLGFIYIFAFSAVCLGLHEQLLKKAKNENS